MKNYSLFDDRSKLRTKVIAVEPFLPEWVSAAINVVSTEEERDKEEGEERNIIQPSYC